jgi:hypothetical protein
LTIFDAAAGSLWLGETKRLASREQRIVLHASKLVASHLWKAR